MRLFFISLLVLGTFVSYGVFAQSSDNSGRTIYNRTNMNANDSQLYVSSGSNYRSRGPLSIRQMLEGKTDAANGSQYYGGSNMRPYGADDNNYSLSLSPSEVGAARARRDEWARQREKENMRMMQEDDLFATNAAPFNKKQLKKTGIKPYQSRGRRVYRKKTPDLEKPKKVFNSIY